MEDVLSIFAGQGIAGPVILGLTAFIGTRLVKTLDATVETLKIIQIEVTTLVVEVNNLKGATL